MIEKGSNSCFLEGCCARVDDAPDAPNRSQTAGCSLLPPTLPPHSNPIDAAAPILKVATSGHAALRKMHSYHRDHPRLVAAKEELKLEAQRALQSLLQSSGLTRERALRVVADLRDPRAWQAHQAAIQEALAGHAELVGITIRVILSSLAELDDILDIRYPLVPPDPVRVDFGPPPRTPRGGLVNSFRTRFRQFRGSRKVHQCDTILDEASHAVDNLYTIVGEQQRRNRELNHDRRAGVVV
ncbi:hypothetical protein FN846DRAFT_887396 [Sphaerosporella brunnea]|uniref:Uncharacterized protein n=1 Tax=Sphaerosporella brunnea TaxID=1250544 RepID=A0A5J5F5M8_9PEZI|nr:hypothetical protein FN846DRAFT_887396 [Sphaerosporella brunnea]